MGGTCIRVSCVRDLLTADGENIRAGTVVVVYIIQTTVKEIASRKAPTPFETRNYRNSIYHKGI